MASRRTPWANPLLAYWKHGCENPTAAEAALEPAIAALGERYRHQFPFWGLKYFADFALLDRKLIIEVDGDSHNTPEQKEKDLKHSLEVLKDGWFVARVSNELALRNPAKAVEMALGEWRAFDCLLIDTEFLTQKYSALLAQLHQDYPHLLAAAATKSKRRSQSAKAAAQKRRNALAAKRQARDKRAAQARA